MRQMQINDFMMNKGNHSSKIVSRKRRRIRKFLAAFLIRSTIIFLARLTYTTPFSTPSRRHCNRYTSDIFVCDSQSYARINSCLRMSDWGDSSNDSSEWTSSSVTDWEDTANGENDDNIWATFESIDEEGDASIVNDGDDDGESSEDDSEVWLDALAAISAEEIEFNQNENERANKVREMQEWGFDDETIKNTFDVEVDDSRETEDELEGMQEYREDIYEYEEEEELDWNLVESHTRVEMDPDTGEPVRQQMVYVDEHACVGCYNCANIAQSTFFMEDEQGRARVFEQWGDDDDTISCAIETCPVDCIHYIEYDELVRLETERRGQNINFKARLVNQGAAGNFVTIGATSYTAPAAISEIGDNPEFEKEELERKAKKERRVLTKQREEENKSVEL